MATTVILPKLGQTMEEGAIVEWLKKEGDPIDRGDVLFTIESDKAVLEVESKAKGVLRKILLDAGVTVPVLTPVAIIAKEDEDISDALAQASGGKPATAVSMSEKAEEALTAETPVAVEDIGDGERIKASPRARKLASEKGVDLTLVKGSGPQGRIIERDIDTYLASAPAATPLAKKVAEDMGVSLASVQASGSRITVQDVKAQATAHTSTIAAPATPVMGEEKVVPMSGVRAIVAQHMSSSQSTTASVTLHSQVDATEFVALREKLRDAYAKELGFNIGYNDILAMIIARCLSEYPYMNVQLKDDGIHYLPYVNMGMAVDSERGLLVPVIRNANTLGIKEIASQFRTLVTRAREGKSAPDDLSGGTFTITNLGMFGTDLFTPIINSPECAIMGVGRITDEPAVVAGQICIRKKMWLSLTFDHRLVDGGPAARFLQGITRYIEEPYLLLG